MYIQHPSSVLLVRNVADSCERLSNGLNGWTSACFRVIGDLVSFVDALELEASFLSLA